MRDIDRIYMEAAARGTALMLFYPGVFPLMVLDELARLLRSELPSDSV
jgi:hypothetical protein